MTRTLVADDFQGLFRAAQAGDSPAVRALVDEFSRPLEGYLRRRGVADWESAANSILERALRRGDQDRIVSRPTFRGYLYAIARNEVVSERRHAARRVSLDLVDDPETSVAWSEVMAPAADAEVLVSLSVDELLSLVNRDQAEVLELRLLEGQTLEATATILGKSVSSVTSLQYRGLLRLRRAVSIILAAAIVLATALSIGRPDIEAPVISDETGFDESLLDEKRFDGSRGVPVPDETQLPEEVGGGTTDQPLFTIDSRTWVHSLPPKTKTDVDLSAKALELQMPVGPGAIEPATSPAVITTETAATEPTVSAEPTIIGEAWADETQAATPAPVMSTDVVVSAPEEPDAGGRKGRALGIAKGAGCQQARKNAGTSPATCAGDLGEVIASRSRDKNR